MFFELFCLVLLAALAFVVFKAASGGGRKSKSKPKTPEKTPERAAKEDELLLRLERLKKKQDKAADAVHSDPARAARAVRAMMNRKSDRK